MEHTSGPMVRRINSERVVLLGWGRAILLQLAHPLVAAAVSDHSDYDSGFLQYLRRTRQTVGSMLSLTFGTPVEVQATADRINGIHRRVHGRLQEATHRFPAGTPYTATDPELLAWVHMTLVESQLTAYERFVRPLEPDEKDQYCRESVQIAPLLEIPNRVLPESYLKLTGRLKSYYLNGTIEVTETARRLAHALLYPPGGVLSRSALGVGRLATIGLLPEAVRSAYGFEWGQDRARWLGRVAGLLRWSHQWAPRLVTKWPAAQANRPLPSGECPLHHTQKQKRA